MSEETTPSLEKAASLHHGGSNGGRWSWQIDTMSMMNHGEWVFPPINIINIHKPAILYYRIICLENPRNSCGKHIHQRPIVVALCRIYAGNLWNCLNSSEMQDEWIWNSQSYKCMMKPKKVPHWKLLGNYWQLRQPTGLKPLQTRIAGADAKTRG